MSFQGNGFQHNAFQDGESLSVNQGGDPAPLPSLGLLLAAGGGGGGITGSASITLGALTASGTGTLSIAGSASNTLGALTSAATGTLAIAGSLSKTLGALTSTATGTVAIAGSLSKTLADLTVIASGHGPQSISLIQQTSTLVQTFSGGSWSPSTGSLTGVVADNLLLSFGGWWDATNNTGGTTPAPTDNNGTFSKAGSAAPTNPAGPTPAPGWPVNTQICETLAAASGSHTITPPNIGSGGDGYFQVAEFAGTGAGTWTRVDQGYGIARDAVAGNVDGVTATTDSTSALIGDLVVAVAVTDGDPTAIGIGSPTTGSWTNLINSATTTDNVSVGAAYRIADADGAQSAVWAWADAACEIGTASIAVYRFTPDPAPIEGTASITLAALTASGTGALAIAGTGSNTLAALTAAGTGTLSIAGSGSVTLGALTASAAGALAITGSGAVTLADLTLAGTGVLAAEGTGSLAVTLDALTVSAAGALALSATLTSTLGDLTAAGSGTVAITGSGNATLAALTASGTGQLAISGASTVTLDALTLSAAGAGGGFGTLNVTLDDLTASGTGELTGVGTQDGVGDDSPRRFLQAWNPFAEARRKARAKREADAAQAAALADETAREIAQHLHEQIALEAKQAEIAQLRDLVEANKATIAKELTDARLIKAYRALTIDPSDTMLESFDAQMQALAQEQEDMEMILAIIEIDDLIESRRL